MKNTRKIVIIGFFIALQIVLARFLGIETPIVRISFGFLPIAFSAMLFGPVVGATTATMADIIGMLIFPKGAYFPGFTVSAAMGGAIYGMFLYKKPKTLVNVFITCITITLFVNLGLNTIWLSMITGKAVYAIIIPRIIKELIELPIKALLIVTAWKAVGVYLDKTYGNMVA